MIKAKVTYFKRAKLLKLLEEETDKILDCIADNVQKTYREEVPMVTGNLRDATVKERMGKVGTMKGINVGTDTDQAPYAPYVLFPAGQHGIPTKTDRKRNYSGNDWITRTTNKSLTRIPQITNQAFKDLNGIEI